MDATGAVVPRSSSVAKSPLRSLRGFERFYEKVIKVKADVAASFLVLCGFRHISAETFASGSLRSDDWQRGRSNNPVSSCSRLLTTVATGRNVSCFQLEAAFFAGIRATSTGSPSRSKQIRGMQERKPLLASHSHTPPTAAIYRHAITVLS